MNKNMMNNIGLLGIIVLMITMLIACDSESGGGETPPVGTSNLYTWGLNNYGRLGNGNQISQATPVAIGNKTWKQVSAGQSHSMAIDSDGHLYAWGRNNYGQFGDGNGGSLEDDYSTTPVAVGTKTWTQVRAGSIHTVAIDTDGHLYAWGGNGSGQLGIGTETVNGSEELVDKYEPVQIGDGSKTWTQVSTGLHTMAIDNAGHLFVWGDNGSGQLGNGNTTDSTTPVKIGTKTWTQVSAGVSTDPNTGVPSGFTIAIDSNNRLYAWGDNLFGQFGNGSTTGSTTPVLIGTKTWKKISTGKTGGHAIAIDTDDHLFTWGYNGEGQLGNGNTTDSTTPVAIEPTKTWTQIGMGNSHTIAIDTDGHLFAWGSNKYGQLGNGNKTNQTTPVAIEPTKTWTQISAGGSHTVGIIQEQEDTP